MLSVKRQLRFPDGILNRAAKRAFEAATGTRGLRGLICK